jgi:GPH family glycoside/pentoside/hexuronide:cation symporter
MANPQGDRSLPSTTAPAARFYYGMGAIAYGIKDSGFSYLLLLYYNQVLGLSEDLVGAGIFLALLVDAVSDPVVGSASDHLKSRWGRRHPFMYASAAPVAICYFFLWSPPEGLTAGALFSYFLVFAILVRLTLTLYEIPSSALVAELTDDYHQRTMFLSLRHFFGWSGGLAIAVSAYTFWLVPTDEYPVGVLNRDGYQTYGLVTSALMFGAILLSSLGTHRYIPQLKQPPAGAYPTALTMLKRTWETIRERSFGALFLSAMFGALATGMSASMSIYISTFYWELDNRQIALIASTAFGSALCALWIAPRVSRLLGKKRAAITIGMLSALLSPLPILLRVLDLFPDNGTRELLYALMTYQLLEITLIITTAILVDSMIADVVEQSQLRTGRRSEGVFFAARNFIRKSVSGIGVLMATTLLSMIDFPRGAQPGAVPPEITWNLGLVYAPTIFFVYLLAILSIFAYRISQAVHEDNLRALQESAD